MSNSLNRPAAALYLSGGTIIIGTRFRAVEWTPTDAGPDESGRWIIEPRGLRSADPMATRACWPVNRKALHAPEEIDQSIGQLLHDVTSTANVLMPGQPARWALNRFAPFHVWAHTLGLVWTLSAETGLLHVWGLPATRRPHHWAAPLKPVLAGIEQQIIEHSRITGMEVALLREAGHVIRSHRDELHHLANLAERELNHREMNEAVTRA